MPINTFLQSIIITAILALGSIKGAYAGIEIYSFSSERLQARFENLSQELRCPKCQNQNLAGSDSLIANDLRNLIKQQLEDGRSDTEIKAYLVARYGDFILYDPPLKSSTVLLWSLPWLAFLVGLVIILTLRRTHKARPIIPLTKADIEQLIKKTSKRNNPHD